MAIQESLAVNSGTTTYQYKLSSFVSAQKDDIPVPQNPPMASPVSIKESPVSSFSSLFKLDQTQAPQIHVAPEPPTSLPKDIKFDIQTNFESPQNQPLVHLFTKEQESGIDHFGDRVTQNTLQIKRLAFQLKRLETLFANLEKSAATSPEKKAEMVQEIQEQFTKTMQTTFVNIDMLKGIGEIWEERFKSTAKKIEELTVLLKDNNNPDKRKIEIRNLILAELQIRDEQLKNIETKIAGLLENKKKLDIALVAFENMLKTHESTLKDKLQGFEEKLSIANKKLDNIFKQVETLSKSVSEIRTHISAIDQRVSILEQRMTAQNKSIENLQKNIEKISSMMEKEMIRQKNLLEIEKNKEQISDNLAFILKKNEQDIASMNKTTRTTTVTISTEKLMERETKLNEDLAKKVKLAETLNLIQSTNEDDPKIFVLLKTTEQLIQDIKDFKSDPVVDQEVLKGKNSIGRNIYSAYTTENTKIMNRMKEFQQYFGNASTH